MSTLVSMSFPEAFAIGYNGYGQAGFGHTNSIMQLTQIKTKKLITKIHPSRHNAIYTDDEFNNILVSGRNNYGQLGINTIDAYITTLTPLTFLRTTT